MKFSKGHLIRKLSALSLCVVMLLMMTITSSRADWQGTYLDAKNSVVRIYVSSGSSASLGSGFGIGVAGEAPEYFLTNRHVVYNEDTGKLYDNVYLVLEDDAIVNTYYYGPFSEQEIQTDEWDENTKKDFYWTDTKILKKETFVRCEVLYPVRSSGEFPDIAILKAERPVTERIAVPLKSGWDVESGVKIYTMGYPSSADEQFRTDYTGKIESVNGKYYYVYTANIAGSVSSMTVADGIISSTVNVARFDNETVFQHTAQMNHGNSGGPLVTEDGYVVGINTYGFNTADNGLFEYKASVFIDYSMQVLDKLGIRYDKYDPDAIASTPAPSAIPTARPASTGVLSAPIIVLALLLILMTIGGCIVLIILLVKRKNSTRYVLVGLGGYFMGRTIPIKKQLRIGRRSSNDIVFPANTEGVSSVHCRIDLGKDGLTLTDCGSTYGTFLNRQLLQPHHPVLLNPGDVFCLANGGISFCVQEA